MNTSIRTFLAIPLAPEIREAVAQTQNHLKTLDCDIKWVNPDNIHLTLKFLGDVPLKHIGLIRETLGPLVKTFAPMNIETGQPGAFPSIDHPRILWVGLKNIDNRIGECAACLESAFGKIGFTKEPKTFSPHMTIGRTRSPRNLKALSETLLNYTLPTSMKQTVKEIILYKSTLTSQGPLYEALEHFFLTGKE